MLAAALAVSAIAFVAARSGFVHAHAASSLRFHGVVAAVVGVLAAMVFVSPVFDNHPLTLENPPKTFQAVLGIAVFAFGIVLPLVESIRALVGGLAAWPGPRAGAA